MIARVSSACTSVGIRRRVATVMPAKYQAEIVPVLKNGPPRSSFLRSGAPRNMVRSNRRRRVDPHVSNGVYPCSSVAVYATVAVVRSDCGRNRACACLLLCLTVFFRGGLSVAGQVSVAVTAERIQVWPRTFVEERHEFGIEEAV